MSKPRRRRKRGNAAARGRSTKPIGRQPLRRSTLVMWGIVGLLTVTALAGFLVESHRSGALGLRVTRPSVVNGPDNGVQRGNPQAPVLVDEYGDFTCPVCRRLQTTMGPTIDKLIQRGTIRFNYHPMDLLLQNGQDTFQAANAALCAGDVSAAGFWRMHVELLMVV
jgi:protein-disulfide isomerase